MSGIKINPQCVTEFNDFKVHLLFSSACITPTLTLLQMGKSKHSYIVFAATPDLRELTIERCGAASESWNDMLKALPTDGPRYIVTQYNWDLGLDGKRSRTVFILWVPEKSTLKNKMIYAASKQSFRQALTGVQVDVAASDPSELTSERMLEVCQRFSKA